MLLRSTLRSDCAAVLASGSRRRTRFVRCALYAQTTATSQITKRAARADPEAALLAAPQIAPTAHHLPRGTGCGVRPKHHERLSKGASGQAAVRLWGAEQRRARGLARSASCQLTRRICLNAAHAVRVVSYATGPRDRAAQGSRRISTTAPAKRCSLPGRAFAAPLGVCAAALQEPPLRNGRRPAPPRSLSRRASN